MTEQPWSGPGHCRGGSRGGPELAAWRRVAVITGGGGVIGAASQSVRRGAEHEWSSGTSMLASGCRGAPWEAASATGSGVDVADPEECQRFIGQAWRPSDGSTSS